MPSITSSDVKSTGIRKQESSTGPRNYKAWVAKAAKQPMVLETVDLAPLGAEDVEVEVEHCGLCHSDLSVLTNEWGLSQYPATLGHEVIGRVTIGAGHVWVADNEAMWAFFARYRR